MSVPNGIHIIQEEHQRVAAVLHCLDQAIRGIVEERVVADLDLLSSIIQYLVSFLFQFHHPKEEFYLFDALRKRYPEAGKLLDALNAEHRLGDQLIETCRTTLDEYRYGGPSAFGAFRVAAEAYLRFEREHMRKEEQEVLPLAHRYLTDQDWMTIEQEFTANDDPLFGKQKETRYSNLFSTIQQLAPPSFGCDAPVARGTKSDESL